MPEKKFTDEEVAQLKQAFALFDLDGNGFITNDELGTVLRKMGQEPTDEEVDAMIAEIDEHIALPSSLSYGTPHDMRRPPIFA